MLPRCLIFCALLVAPSPLPSPAPSPLNVVRVGHNIAIPPDSRFHNVTCLLCSTSLEGRAGSVRVFAGNIFLDGPVMGNVIAMGGNITLTGRASVGGRVVVFGGRLYQNPAAVIPERTVFPPIIFLPLMVIICAGIGGLIALTRRMAQGPVIFPPLPRL